MWVLEVLERPTQPFPTLIRVCLAHPHHFDPGPNMCSKINWTSFPQPHWVCVGSTLWNNIESGVLWKLVHIFMAKTRERIIHQQQGLDGLWRLRAASAPAPQSGGKKHRGFFKARLVWKRLGEVKKSSTNKNKVTIWSVFILVGGDDGTQKIYVNYD